MKRKTIANKTAPVPISETRAVEIKKPFTFRVTIVEPTYLRVGDVICFQQREHVVCDINDCCARIVPVTEGMVKQVVFTPKFSDKPVTFKAPERNAPIAISANSESPILRRLGKDWREKLHSVTSNTAPGGEIAGAKPAATSTAPKRGRGRPRKEKPHERNTGGNSVQTLDSSSRIHSRVLGGSEPTPVKRGRGRPPGSKNKLHK